MADLAAGTQVLDPSTNQAFVARATDPSRISTNAYTSPADFAAQFPQPLDTTEIVAMCEEVTVYKWLPVVTTGLQSETWRELNSLAFVSGTASISFKSGECPESYTHDGANTTVTTKWIGTRKELDESDIMHSLASQAAGVAIRALNGPHPWGEMLPGANQMATFGLQAFAGLKEKELILGTTLVLNGWDNLLINGNDHNNALQFPGFEHELSTGTHQVTATGTFEADAFDRFLTEGCAKPTVLVTGPQAAQGIFSAYMKLGFQGAQIIEASNPVGITPGFNFSGYINTAIGRLGVVADNNVPRTDLGGGVFNTHIYGLRMTHNGEQLVYRLDQIPFQYKDLQPGCTTIQFMLYARTALIVKHKCAHHLYSANFTGNIVTTCPVIL